MNIFIVNDFGLKGGGAEKRTLLLLQQMLKEGKLGEVHVIEKFSSQEKPKGKFFFYKAVDRKAESEKLFNRILDEKKIGIVQVHNSLYLPTNFVRIAKNKNIPVVFFAHDYWPVCGWRSFINPERFFEAESCEKSHTGIPKCAKPLTLVKLKLMQRELNNADAGIAPSDFAVNKFSSFGLLKGKWKKVLPWINLKEFFPPAKEHREKFVLFVGSLKAYKGAFVLVNAFREISEKFPGVQLVFAGHEEGAPLAKMKEFVNGKWLGKRVKFLGKKSEKELRELYQQAGLLVFPSTCMEMFGSIWAEAMACGCPIIASDVAGMKELAGGKVVLFENGNSSDLQEKIIELLEDRIKASAGGKSGTGYATKSFDVRRASKEMKSIYDEIIQR
ncbi:MAG: glycosyltransferase family 4 protein [Candidatus Diapherotrites archaeon]|uniref:Glycosyltransferase family 4 protein n=1 Tax=Candidatus Iainarchaeum sp. TaxID=3101447 RepID=A0A7J4IUW8_9ARCH|nr:MAG: glycosyltransferase [archaeon GW2011_AR10]MBS3058953.1 glycosyltransferase family 4 protein [Candidatus Diapherotrites archaeon]HIH08620.1 glycosyltransferase family 4 protein [Candidatus Diapherotrites archaeon]